MAQIPGRQWQWPKAQRPRFHPEFDSTANRYRIGMWVGTGVDLMMFTALSSAYIVRAASSNDWNAIAMPRIFLVSTALILSAA